MAKKDKRLWIDCAAGSELMDTQGETLSVEGADISDLEAGRGRWNDNHGKGNWNSLGMITEAKKIFKAEDCENDRQRYYWDKIKAAYIYTKGYLYSNEDHGNARAAAAIIRNIHREDCPLKMKASVEGGVISRGITDSSRLAHTKIHSVALTFTPANNATLVEPLNLDKSNNSDWESDKQLIKSVMHLAETNVPSFRHVERHASAHTIHDNILKIQELAKILGIDIHIANSDPKEIMQKAVLNKVASSVSKIRSLVKAINNNKVYDMMKPATTSPGKVAIATESQKAAKLKATDSYQQGLGRLKSDPSTPTKPVDTNAAPVGASVVRSAVQAQKQNTLKSHASRAMKDPNHLNVIHQGLTERGIHPNKIKAIISKVKSHMVKSEDDMEKGDIARAAKNLLVVGALAHGAHSLSPHSDTKTNKDPTATEMSREQKIEEHNKKIKDPDLMISPKEYDQRKPSSKKEWIDRRKKFKESVKKALMAGYGGAGAPGNLAGGGVVQSESLDDGRSKNNGLSYIACDECGHEQVFMPHQVKCRDCKKNFSLSKLENYL